MTHETDNVRKAIVQAQFNEENSGLIGEEAIIIAIVMEFYCS